MANRALEARLREVTRQSIADRKVEMGAKVDFHCPYDEATLRVSLRSKEHHICPVCWTMFPVPALGGHDHG